jgi:hypothetical protein
MRNDDKALKHVVGLLNACGASWFDPEHYAPAATGEYGSGYQPETFAAQEFLREQGGGWADGADHFDATGWDERPADSNRCAVEEAQAILDRLAREGWTVQRLPSATCRAPYCLDAIPGMRCPTCPERRDG